MVDSLSGKIYSDSTAGFISGVLNLAGYPLARGEAVIMDFARRHRCVENNGTEEQWKAAFLDLAQMTVTILKGD